MQLAVLGNYGATNIGDEAILSALLKAHPGHDFVIFSANPENTEERHSVKAVPLFPLGFRSFFRYGFRRSLKALQSVDAVILGGGGLFQDDRLYACFLWAWQCFWIRWVKKPLFVYGLGVGPLKTSIGRWLTRYALSRAAVITVRDEASQKLLQEIDLTQGDIHVTADPAFLIKPCPGPFDRIPHRFLISLRPWLTFNSILLKTFTDCLLKWKAEHGAHFVFAAMQKIKEHDHAILEPLMKRVGGELFHLKDFSELLELMKTAEFAIGMRFHFLIAALITQTPSLPICYSPKAEALFKGTPLEPYALRVDGLSVERLDNNLKRLSVDYNNVKVYGKKRAEFFMEQAQKNVELLNRFIADLQKSIDAADTVC